MNKHISSSAPPSGAIKGLFKIGFLGMLFSLSNLLAADEVVNKAVVERGQNHKIIEFTRNVTDATGETKTVQGRYTVLANGMHYKEDGRWVESKELIEPFEKGAVARQGAYKVIFNWNLNTPGAIDIQMPKGERVRAHPLGLSLTDYATDQSALIAQVRDTVGEILEPNQIIYRDAFEGISADVLFTYEKGRFESDVILRQAPVLPEGFDPETTRIEVLTEFVQAPEPKVKERNLPASDDKAKRKRMKLPWVTDQRLDFGSMTMGMGRAFKAAGNGKAKGRRTKPIVSKKWRKIRGRNILCESIGYVEMLEMNAELKQAEAEDGELRITSVQERELPPAPRAVDEQRSMQLASAPVQSGGVVVDYVFTGSYDYLAFYSGHTYLVGGTLSTDGPTYFHEGTVIKYLPDAQITLSGTVYCYSTADNKAILTAWDDDTVGTTITGYDDYDEYCASMALHLYNADEYTTLEGLQFRYAQTAIQDYSPYCSHTIKDCDFLACYYGVKAYYTTIIFSSYGQTVMCGVNHPTTNMGSAGFSGSYTTLASEEDEDGDKISNEMELFQTLSDPLEAYSKNPNSNITDGEWYYTSVTGQYETRINIYLDVANSYYDMANDYTELYFVISGAEINDLYDIYIETESNNQNADSQVWQFMDAETVYIDSSGYQYLYAKWPGNVPLNGSVAFAALDIRDRSFDGIPDGYEIMVLQTIVGNADSNNNEIADGDDDPDQDGITNAREYIQGTDPLVQDDNDDSNNNGIPDWYDNYITYWRGLSNVEKWGDADGDDLPNVVEYDIGCDPIYPDYWEFNEPPGGYTNEDAQFVSMQFTEVCNEPDVLNNDYFPNFGCVAGPLGLGGAMLVKTDSGTATLKLEIWPLDSYNIYRPFSDNASPDQLELQKPSPSDGEIYRNLLISGISAANILWHQVDRDILNLMSRKTLEYVHAVSMLRIQKQFRKIQYLEYLKTSGVSQPGIMLRSKRCVNIIQAEFTKITAISIKYNTTYPSYTTINRVLGAAKILGIAVKWYNSYDFLQECINGYILDVMHHNGNAGADILSTKIQEMLNVIWAWTISTTTPIFSPNPLGWYDGYN
ncbi:MAG: hypothetical protein K9N48_02270 [Verrucomicrobia bacterium]|nr:hypothetical protein [Verrucomicrobiota bacterium]MCF7708822.1 hypothetical protein [Verrucomicrobiota bacterium]